MKFASFLKGLFLLLLPLSCFAQTANIIKAPQPTTCITGTFSSTGTSWKNINLTLKNTCGVGVDVRSTTITFNTKDNLNTTFWGNFGNVSYPDNASLNITSQPATTGGFLATLSFHIPDADWANSILANKGVITLSYGAATAGYVQGSVNVYLASTPPTQTGSISLTNSSAKPTNVTQTSAAINLVMNGTTVQTVQLPWSGTQVVPGLNVGTYNIQATSVTATNGTVYQGTATPASVAVTSGQTVSSKISYAAVAQPGSIKIQVPALPSQLTGYTSNPAVTLTNTSTGSTSSQSPSWNATTTVSQLTNGATYSLATPNIVFNNFNCAGTFTPASVVSSSTTPPTSVLSYTCVQVSPATVSLKVSGAPSSTSAVTLTFTPSTGTTPVTQAVNLTNGSGTGTVPLVQNTIYNVSATNVSGFSTTFQPQPLTATNGATETVTYSAVTPPPPAGGRVIAYLPGWLTPPPAAQLAAAGYTHMLVAFGVFSTTSPGQITSAFDTVTASYIQSLHAAGIKVLLSIGGASTSLPNTTVNFDQVLKAASSPAAFQSAFIASLNSLVTQFGFDGVDFDIESGLGVGGTISAPTGDVAALANIINQIHANSPNFLISLAPQTANISATSSLNETWANYAALIMQTSKALSWVGIQLYNTGCMNGIDGVCYDPNATSSPNFSVAMATDLLANWPSTSSTGQPTGFQPYISMLNSNQVVLGYPAPNAQGGSDGAPVTPVATIKRAIQCMQTAVKAANSCDTFVPPKAYGLLGGVFEWEVTYDQSNNYAFATGLKACATTGACT